ncbi:Dihydrolipoyllysine-residue acetyltransferase component of pyruvate dehydrogenase complex, mitochondrial [Hondaea fermentalgiana]|uniref:Dihydrolipoyllysine-residue acetyltransferase component of pyruvate dehydrogenase complex, mitochondrial n=1 Tax=Hondaea fermentalgiana TaxID=2315210 RepID=A0A2R5GVD3_9STRA|nr:Dihydrolipoyllysine-residue acetyltransferase component of pyruvate dehydrogenase complex, mitochondrial [Hondaea fermentalgiana]|eukprot:GBG32613.1 Dihydrolipoyllysine-residue acetyltransferase component of pyruvate dehydrogenase complex, mitochondrial [Hondaea fermentalgiana]
MSDKAKLVVEGEADMTKENDDKEAEDPAKMSGEELLEHAAKVLLPDDGYDSSSVATWYKEEGDKIRSSESLVEIETPEFSYDFQSSVSGVLAKIVKQAGAEVKSGSVLAYIGSTEEEATEIQAYMQSEEYAELKRAKKRRAEEAEKAEDADSSSSGEDASKDGADQGDETHEVRMFLKNLESDMSRYTDDLIENGFDSIPALATVEMEDLTQSGVKKGHARLIMRAIDQYNGKEESK